MGMRELKNEAAKLVDSGITNRANLDTALPILVDLQATIEIASTNLKKTKEVLNKLIEQCSEYALAHESIFAAGRLVETAKGIKVGDYELGDKLYHFSAGFKGYKRLDDDAMTQSFLAELPKDWVKVSTALDTTAINREKPDAAELEKYDLMQKPNYLWSVND